MTIGGFKKVFNRAVRVCKLFNDFKLRNEETSIGKSGAEFLRQGGYKVNVVYVMDVQEAEYVFCKIAFAAKFFGDFLQFR